LEVATRWSSINLNDNPVFGGEMDILSVGVSWWLSPIFNVNLNYRYIANDRNDLDGRASGANVRILLKLR
jgi:phosphate-selective porin